MTNETARPDSKDSDGPSLQAYVETRLALLAEHVDDNKQYFEKRFDLLVKERDTVVAAGFARIDERIDRTVALREALQKSIDDHFAHADKVNTLVQESAKRAVDKAEATQLAHNVAANEWRGTLNDIAARLVARPEFNRLSDDFAAYRLESERKFAAAIAEKTVIKEVKDDGRATWAIIISIVFGLASFIGTVIVLVTRH